MSNVRRLILIKHASPLKDPSRPAEEWELSPAGREAAGRLASELKPLNPTRIITSGEPKAVETGQIVAAALSIPCESAEELGEHDRSDVPMMRTGEFISAMEHFFRVPGELVFGGESADECEDRFSEALDRAVARYPDDTLAVVSHGTVLALYLAPILEMPPYDLWRKMGLPSYADVNVETKNVRRLVNGV